MGLIAHWWLCPTCRCTSGKAGHIGCTGPDGKPQPAPMELVPAATYQGAVGHLRALVANAPCLCDHPARRALNAKCSKCKAEAFLTDAGGQ